MNREAFLARLDARLAAAAPPATAHPPKPPPATVPRPGFPRDERSLEERFGAALHAIRGRLATVEELPALFEELEIRTAVVTTDLLELPEVERLPLEQARDADAGVTAAVAACAVTGTVVLAPSASETRMASLLAARARRRRAARRAGRDARRRPARPPTLVPATGCRARSRSPQGRASRPTSTPR